MKNIWMIFKTDLSHIGKNVIALVVILGLTVVPCLYAWFNIAGSWNPYENTGNLKVAVASEDEGYEGTLIPLEFNIGDQVLSAMRENTQMDWVFTGAEKAVEGVESGKYYAAIVIPEDFSNKMMSVFSDNAEKTELIYYSNAKENAIAPKVTDKGATSIQKQINEIFLETISDTTITVFQAISNLSEETGADMLFLNLTKNMNQIADEMVFVNTTLQSFADMTGSAQKLIDTTTELTELTLQQTENGANDLNEAQKTFSDIDEVLKDASAEIDSALKTADKFYTQMSDVVDDAFESASKDVDAAADSLDAMAAYVEQMSAAYTGIRNSVASIGEQHPELSGVTGTVIDRLDGSIAVQKELSSSLRDASKGIRGTADDMAATKRELHDLIKESKDSVSQVRSDYEDGLKADLDELSESLGTTLDDVTALLVQLNSGVDKISEYLESADGDMSAMREALCNSCDLLTDAANRIYDTTGKIGEMKNSGDYSELADLIMGNKSEVSKFLAAPVALETHKVYEVENYGSAMAPFYSTLSIWIGGIILIAMIKTNVSEECRRKLKNPKEYQLYFGRQMIFQMIGLLQSTLIAVGDLLFLKIQCQYPFLFILACWVSSIVYVNIIYTLTLSFGDIGKAIGVILLVVQVAGTGGTFPVEVTTPFFKALYPLLPFTHSMAAMREVIGGMYRTTYWEELGILLIFMVFSLILGLLLRKPVIRINDAFNEKLEETKLM